jgi:hypothetical protein
MMFKANPAACVDDRMTAAMSPRALLHGTDGVRHNLETKDLQMRTVQSLVLNKAEEDFLHSLRVRRQKEYVIPSASEAKLLADILRRDPYWADRPFNDSTLAAIALSQIF